MEGPRTIRDALELARDTLQGLTPTPSLDAQLLLMNATGQPRAWILAHAEAKLQGAAAEGFQRSLRRLVNGEALPYVLGWWEFFGRRFRVSPEVMIPRPETELLVDRALRILAERTDSPSVLDLGTGCGTIAVTLAAEEPNLRLVASDLSRGALEIARANAQAYGVVEQIRWVQADLLSPFAAPFDLICANLPYIPSNHLTELVVARREPTLALDGGVDGLAAIGRSLEELPRVLGKGGAALFEIEASQGVTAKRLAEDALRNSQVAVRRDLAGEDRLLDIRFLDQAYD